MRPPGTDLEPYRTSSTAWFEDGMVYIGIAQKLQTQYGISISNDSEKTAPRSGSYKTAPN